MWVQYCQDTSTLLPQTFQGTGCSHTLQRYLSGRKTTLSSWLPKNITALPGDNFCGFTPPPPTSFTPSRTHPLPPRKSVTLPSSSGKYPGAYHPLSESWVLEPLPARAISRSDNDKQTATRTYAPPSRLLALTGEGINKPSGTVYLSLLWFCYTIEKRNIKEAEDIRDGVPLEKNNTATVINHKVTITIKLIMS